MQDRITIDDLERDLEQVEDPVETIRLTMRAVRFMYERRQPMTKADLKLLTDTMTWFEQLLIKITDKKIGLKQ